MFTSAVVSIVVRNTIFRKAPPSVVSGYDKRSINLNKVVATFEKHIFLSQTDLTRTGIISNIGVAPKKKVVRPMFFLSEGVISRIFVRYIHKNKFLCIFSQMKNNAYLPVHLVHAPSFWWSPSYSFTFSFLCVFFQFLYAVRYFCLRFLCFVFVS